MEIPCWALLSTPRTGAGVKSPFPLLSLALGKEKGNGEFLGSTGGPGLG